MLRVPDTGVTPYSARNGHQSDLNIVADWLEGSVLFGNDDSLSVADIKDVLADEHIYDNQDKASEFLADVWREIHRRGNTLGASYPIVADGLKLVRQITWKESPAYSFCLLLSYSERYPDWRKSFGKNFTEQGLLFEEVTAEALRHEMTDWQTYSTGWARTRTDRIYKSIETIRGVLGEEPGRLDMIPNLSDIKDAGLDLVLWRPFSDSNIGYPLYLVQCASGANWEKKRTEPEVDFWRTMIDFAVTPKKALAIPYAISEREYWITCRRINGMFLDRFRLLSGGRRNSKWVSTDVRRRLVTWMQPRVKLLPIL